MASVAHFALPIQSEEIAMGLHERIVRWRRYRTMVRELSAYPLHELSELGIARADIGRIAWDETVGRSAPPRIS